MDWHSITVGSAAASQQTYLWSLHVLSVFFLTTPVPIHSGYEVHADYQIYPSILIVNLVCSIYFVIHVLVQTLLSVVRVHAFNTLSGSAFQIANMPWIFFSDPYSPLSPPHIKPMPSGFRIFIMGSGFVLPILSTPNNFTHLHQVLHQLPPLQGKQRYLFCLYPHKE